MQDLLSKIRQDPRFADPSHSHELPAASALAASAIGVQTSSIDEGAAEGAELSRRSPLLKIGGITAGVGVTAGIALLMFGVVSPKSVEESNQTQPRALVDGRVTSNSLGNDPSKSAKDAGIRNIKENIGKPESGNPAPGSLNTEKRSEPIQETFLLDRYPPLIKASLLDTVRGISNFAPSQKVAEAPQKASNNPQSGNLFKLLEKASSNSTGVPGNGSAPFNPPTDFDNPLPPEMMNEEPPMIIDPSEEEAKREEIRSRFLEAIRAAAERRGDPTDEGL